MKEWVQERQVGTPRDRPIGVQRIDRELKICSPWRDALDKCGTPRRSTFRPVRSCIFLFPSTIAERQAPMVTQPERPSPLGRLDDGTLQTGRSVSVPPVLGSSFPSDSSGSVPTASSIRSSQKPRQISEALIFGDRDRSSPIAPLDQMPQLGRAEPSIVKTRTGSVLSRGFILKTDHYPSGAFFVLTLSPANTRGNHHIISGKDMCN